MKSLKRTIVFTGFIISFLIPCALSAFSFEAVRILPGQTLTVSFTESSSVLFEFKAGADGRYYFTSVSSADTKAVLYDENFNELLRDDDSGDTSNFRIDFNAEEGHTYYLLAAYYDEKINIDMSVSLILIEADETHIHSFCVKNTKEATCTQNGEVTNMCICGYTYISYTPLKPHNFKTTVETEPTCTKSGKSKDICVTCGLSRSVTTEKLGHAYSSKITVDKPSTTESAGSRSRHCLRCGARTDTSTIYKVTKITLSSDSYTYDGKVKTPAVTVKNSKGEKLKSAKDYTVTYQSGRKKVGTYKVTVNFKGAYSGTAEKSFTVVPENVSKVTAKSTETSITLSWKKAAGASKYRVYRYNEKTRKYTIVAETAKTTVKLKELKSGTKYHFFVKALKTAGKKTYKSKSSVGIIYATVPKAPSFKVKAGTRSAEIRWKKTRCSGYIIYMYNKSSKTYEQAKKITKSDVTTYSKRNLTRGKTYSFKIRAYVTAGDKTFYSPLSEKADVTVK